MTQFGHSFRKQYRGGKVSTLIFLHILLRHYKAKGCFSMFLSLYTIPQLFFKKNTFLLPSLYATFQFFTIFFSALPTCSKPAQISDIFHRNLPLPHATSLYIMALDVPVTILYFLGCWHRHHWLFEVHTQFIVERSSFLPFMLSADNIRAAAHFDDGGKRWDTVKNSKAANFTFLHSLLIMVNKCLEF